MQCSLCPDEAQMLPHSEWRGGCRGACMRAGLRSQRRRRRYPGRRAPPTAAPARGRSPRPRPRPLPQSPRPASHGRSLRARSASAAPPGAPPCTRCAPQLVPKSCTGLACKLELSGPAAFPHPGHREESSTKAAAHATIAPHDGRLMSALGLGVHWAQTTLQGLRQALR